MILLRTICRTAPLLFLALLAAAPPALAQDADDPSRAVGWYRMHSGESLLVTPASDGGLMIFHFGEPPFADRLGRGERGTLVWSRGEGRPEREVRFPPGGGELQWREGAGEWRAAPAIDGPYEPVERSFRSGGVTLSGTIFLPSEPGPRPGVVFIHGSGTSTRDNGWYMRIADRLARSGIAVLLPDKRGSGKSGGEWELASFDDLARDAAAGVAALGAIDAVDRDRIGVLGVSQGGHVAPMVPRLAPELAFVVNLSGSAVPIEEQLELELTNTLRQEGWPRFMIPLVRPIAIRVVKRRMPAWWEMNGAVDPIGHWRELDVPALVVYGAEDERDNVPVRKSVERLRAADGGRKTIDLIVYPDSGHALYAPGSRKIREDFLASLVSWIRSRSRS